MSGSSFIVAVNALMLKRARLPAARAEPPAEPGPPRAPVPSAAGA
jgi:Cu2+-exporting ATPase